jgi:hypothetical protein
LRKSAERVYKGDLGEENAATQFIREQQRAIESDEYPDGTDPYQRLEQELKARYPEVWEDRGEELLRQFREDQPDE